MYSDIFDLDQLGAASTSGAGRNAGASAGNETSPLVSFKAGKMNLEYKADTAKYECVADTARGEIRMVWKEAGLQWQWYDRREKLVKDTVLIRDLPESTFERLPLTDSQHKDDRIYVWTKRSGEYEMFWMQDASEEKDDEVVALVNQYLADPQSAAPEGVTAMDTDNADATGSSGAGDGNQSQVDALSSILENLGMPQSTADSNAAAAATSGDSGGVLTLADLHGAMAGIQSAPASGPGPSLSDVVTPTAISQLLVNEQVKARLMELLPEEQRSAEHLEENLRSPQVQQTLRSLTAALLPDDTGNMDGFYSVLANFSLDPADGNAALAANNPIQAFLDCVLASVEKDKGEEMQEESKEE